VKDGALILAAHGSSHPGAMACLEAFRATVAAEHPGWRVELARTVGRQHGSASVFGGIQRVAAVLEGLAATGVGRVVVQSLHVVPGEEYHEMLSALGRYLENGGRRLSVSVGGPLLADLADVDRVAGAVLAGVPGRTPGEGLVVMGHGAPPPGAGFYAALGERLAARDPLAHFGTMPRARGAACPDIARIRAALVAADVRSAWLLPFFTLAGVHARADLAGAEPGSWRHNLETAGIGCRPLLSGLIESESFAAVWRDHLARSLARLA
jgi:sirohydrochlorin cobaltochelatase